MWGALVLEWVPHILHGSSPAPHVRGPRGLLRGPGFPAAKRALVLEWVPHILHGSSPPRICGAREARFVVLASPLPHSSTIQEVRQNVQPDGQLVLLGGSPDVPAAQW